MQGCGHVLVGQHFSTCRYQGGARRARARAGLTREATLAHGQEWLCCGRWARRFGGGRFANRRTNSTTAVNAIRMRARALKGESGRVEFALVGCSALAGVKC